MASEAVEENNWAQNGGENEVDGGVQNTNSDNTQDFNLSPSAAPQTSGDFALSADGTSEDVGEYDPESVSVTPLPQLGQQNSLKPAPQPTSKKRKTAGGFLVGDSDSEDDSSTPASDSLPAEPIPASNSSPQSPLHASTTAQEAQAAVPNVPSIPQANSAPATSVEAPDSSPHVAAVQSNNDVKLPQDIVTTLEERTKDDPRGAMDAWLDLITELRSRNDIEDTRKVYERFLAVFPQSVSPSITSIHYTGTDRM